MMNDEVTKLRQQVEELAGRVIADSALIRTAVLGASTPQLRVSQSILEKLAEDPGVKLQLRATPHASMKAFEAQRKVWMQVLQQEISSRDASSSQ